MQRPIQNCQTSKKEFKPLTLFAKSFILDVWQGYEYGNNMRFFISVICHFPHLSYDSLLCFSLILNDQHLTIF